MFLPEAGTWTGPQPQYNNKFEECVLEGPEPGQDPNLSTIRPGNVFTRGSDLDRKDPSLSTIASLRNMLLREQHLDRTPVSVQQQV